MTLSDIEMDTKSLKWHGGVGPDGLSPFVVKKCVPSIVWPQIGQLLFTKKEINTMSQITVKLHLVPLL